MNEAAAPSTYLPIFPLIPIDLAIYISSIRYSDFYHPGFDIIAGAILGIACVYLGFRWYSRGQGWAWALRSYDRAFGRGIGSVTYISDNNTDKGHDPDEGIPRHGGSQGDALHNQQNSDDSNGGIKLGNLDSVRGYGPERQLLPVKGLFYLDHRLTSIDRPTSNDNPN